MSAARSRSSPRRTAARSASVEFEGAGVAEVAEFREAARRAREAGREAASEMVEQQQRGHVSWAEALSSLAQRFAGEGRRPPLGGGREVEYEATASLIARQSALVLGHASSHDVVGNPRPHDGVAAEPARAVVASVPASASPEPL